jgi:6-phosphofructokinase 1
VAAIAAYCREREDRHRHTVICIAEGAKPVGGELTVAGRVEVGGDPIRLGGVAHALRTQLQPLVRSEVRATVLGHVQRGGSPTPFDRVLATQYGNAAAGLVARGEFGRMVTLQAGGLTSIPIDDVAGRNRGVDSDSPLLVCARQIGVMLGDN